MKNFTFSSSYYFIVILISCTKILATSHLFLVRLTVLTLFSYEAQSQSRQCARLSLQSSELASPCPLTRKLVVASPLWFQGGDTLACGDWAEGANSDEGTETLVL